MFIAYRYLKLFSSLLLLLFYAGCSSDGGGGSESPSPIFENRDIFIYGGCEDASCNNDTTFVYDPHTNTKTSIGNNFEAEGLDEALVVDGKIYFEGEDPTNGDEMWVLDPLEPISFGTNPMLIADISPGSSNSNPDNFTLLGGKIYFAAYNPSNGSEPWVYDPNEAISATNPKVLYDIRSGSSGSNPYSLNAVGDKLYFVASDGTNGYEMWVFDPAQAASVSNPQMVYDFNPGSASSNPYYIHVLGDKIYSCSTSPGNGSELTVLDTTQAFGASNPQMVADIYSGTSSGCTNIYSEVNGKIYFQGRDTTVGRELFAYDPAVATSSSNPAVVYDTNPGSADGYPSEPVVYNGVLYYSATDATNGYELRIFDTAQAASATNPAVANINPGNGNSYPYNFTLAGDKVYYVAEDGTNGEELWVFDTTQAQSASNPSMALDLESGGNSSSPDYIHFGSDGLLYFAGYTSAEDNELWRFDPSSSTAELAHSFPGTDSVSPYDTYKFTYSAEVE